MISDNPTPSTPCTATRFLAAAISRARVCSRRRCCREESGTEEAGTAPRYGKPTPGAHSSSERFLDTEDFLNYEFYVRLVRCRCETLLDWRSVAASGRRTRSWFTNPVRSDSGVS
ncbi:hypothetical protein GCM10017566_04620 [Amycolatopsis bartoniae]|uniref:Uncharacterized protein n=1 Tax=Amycolatopsis bartoniae TaxID=941986 RepID=A0A8H9IMR8_9PSEU|nr:hypothetical protein GCM10017566_04620 [Amycolatopsis bartoniae]